MQNYFYYPFNPYQRGLPNLFYSSVSKASRNITPTFNLSSFITKAQRGINTVNQIIPLYKQVKPMYSQAKNSYEGIKKFFNNGIFNKKSNNSIQQNLNNENTINKNENFYQNNGPSSPFFK